MDEELIIETIKKGNLLGIIRYDVSPSDPREWDNLGTMVCLHRRYTLGDEHNLKQEFGAEVILPLYLYDHSNLSISTTPFSSHWDSGQVGFIFASREDILNNFGKKRLTRQLREKTKEILRGEVDIYDQYLRGEVYMIEIYQVETCNLGHEHKTLLTAIGGYYSIEDAKNDLIGIMEATLKEHPAQQENVATTSP